MKSFGLAMGLALASATTAAQAQTVITRQITTEPVETIVTQGPDGTAVIRRPLGPAPVTAAPAATYYDSYARSAPVVSAPRSTFYEPYARPAAPLYGASRDVIETVETVEQPAPATTVRREVVRPRATTATRSVQRARAPAARASSTRTVRTTERVATRPAPAPRTIVLSPQQRQIVYRTIVRERAAPPVVTREFIAPPEALTAYGSAVRPGTYYEPVVSTAPAIAPAPVVEPVSYVGRVLPRSVVFYDVPRSVILNVPATRGFRYAYMDDRVLLVDPATRMVVEELDE